MKGAGNGQTMLAFWNRIVLFLNWNPDLAGYWTLGIPERFKRVKMVRGWLLCLSPPEKTAATVLASGYGNSWLLFSRIFLVQKNDTELLLIYTGEELGKFVSIGVKLIIIN